MFNKRNEIKALSIDYRITLKRIENIEKDLMELKSKQREIPSKEYKYCVMKKGQEIIITANGFTIPDNQNVIFKCNGVVVAWFDRNKVDSIELL